MQAYDRLLWEAMRPKFLENQVVKPQEFVEGIEDLVVCHCDQVPVWLRIGALRQLYTSSEVRSKRASFDAVGPRMHEPGGQVMTSHEPDGMSQMRQGAHGEADRFRVTLELSQTVSNVFKPSEAPVVRHGRLVPMLAFPTSMRLVSSLRMRSLM